VLSAIDLTRSSRRLWVMFLICCSQPKDDIVIDL